MSVDSAVRSAVLSRSGGRCEWCGAELCGEQGWAWSLSHRRPKGMGGSRRLDTDGAANLLVLCGSGTTGCHGWVESQRTQALVAGLLLHSTEDPAAEPLLLRQDRWVYLTPEGGYRDEEDAA